MNIHSAEFQALKLWECVLNVCENHDAEKVAEEFERFANSFRDDPEDREYLQVITALTDFIYTQGPKLQHG